MRHFYFTEEETGEEFIVGAETETIAWEEARGVEDCIRNEYQCDTCLCLNYEMTEEEAEASGYDEY